MTALRSCVSIQRYPPYSLPRFPINAVCPNPKRYSTSSGSRYHNRSRTPKVPSQEISDMLLAGLKEIEKEEKKETKRKNKK